MLRLAYFGPLPPQRTGVADYSMDLLPYLAELTDITVYVDRPEDVGQDLRERVTVRHVESYQAHSWDHDMAVYQIGNSLLHRSTLAAAERHPGVVVLHDHTLHHLIASLTAGEGDFAAYWREMAYAHGRRGADRAWAISRGADTPLFDCPLSERLVDLSLGVVVHSEYLQRRLLERHPRVQVTKVGQPIPLPQERGKREMRSRLGLPEDAFIIITCGHITPERQLGVVAEFYARFHQNHSDTLWLLTGEPLNSMVVWLDDLTRSELGRSIHHLGYVDGLSALYDCIAAADVCINLRHPSAGETSATVLRAMAVGTPVVVSDVGWYRELPDSCCPRIVHDGNEACRLDAAVAPWYEDRALCATAGKAAREYIAATCDPATVASDYLQAIEHVLRSGGER